MERAAADGFPAHRDSAVAIMSDAGNLAVPMTPENERWDSWRAKGRADDLRFRRRLRRVAIDVAAAIAFGGALWFAFQF